MILANTPHGKLLEEWIAYLRIKPKSLLTHLGYTNHTSLYYWYDRKEIKLSKLNEFAGILNISLEKFLQGPPTYKPNESQSMVEDEDITPAWGLHQGKLIENLTKEKKTNLTHFANALSLSRPTIYKLFDKREVDEDTIEKIARYFNLPVSYFMPNGKRRGQYEDKTLIDQLREMEHRQNEFLQQLTHTLIAKLDENKIQLEKLIKQQSKPGKIQNQ